jgi:hypothetical protein
VKIVDESINVLISIAFLCVVVAVPLLAVIGVVMRIWRIALGY